MKRIGVLALQGAFIEHITMLNRLGAEAIPVRLPHELEGLDGLVIPGGESTTIGKLMKGYELTAGLQRLIADGLPVFGTCAGMILLAKQTIGLNGYSLGAMDIVVRRNAFGRQVDSFEVDLLISALGEPPFHAVFIRAPWIENVSPGVEVLAQLPDGTSVAARERNVIVTAFHPELTADTRFHAYFLSTVDKYRMKNPQEWRPFNGFAGE
ncbi:MAG: pyridoxal 5'-phosphate synthase glutaminase subunit PdxT [Chloroflexi bacterium CG07_land_8_20_14_0_80_51_10]|nr:MAG: pyridoxal 5'-phosphate synthase glutaminase subunit PdxT [Chloroflexi bacterium CG07_land_8_20_14_0_80_51_10]